MKQINELDDFTGSVVVSLLYVVSILVFVGLGILIHYILVNYWHIVLLIYISILCFAARKDLKELICDMFIG